jgi:hypothetical protein
MLSYNIPIKTAIVITGIVFAFSLGILNCELVMGVLIACAIDQVDGLFRLLLSEILTWHASREAPAETNRI